MVCSIGSVKMTVMARILASGGFQQAITGEKAGQQKLIGQYMQKELLDSDEPNLIDEEDMHVFDLNPLTDKLHLVRCNSCKRPVKASQFIFHAEHCSSLHFAEELFPDVESGAGNKKPPRKERKKIANAGNHVKSARVHERFAIVGSFESAVSTSQLDGPVGLTSSCVMEAKDISGKISGSDGEMNPLAKRPKLVAASTALSSDDIRTTADVPAPLATKTYYSQRNNRLRAAISYMYHQSSTRECCVGERDPEGNLITWEASAKAFPDKQSDDCSMKKHISFPSRQNADQYAQSFTATVVSTGCQPSNSPMDQFLMTDACTSQVASFGAMATNHHSRPFSFTGNSGQPLPRIQQPNGTLPVS